MNERTTDLLILIFAGTSIGLAWLVVNIKAGDTWLKMLSLFSLLVSFGMALAGLGILANEVLFR